jgi:hypothetical protein
LVAGAGSDGQAGELSGGGGADLFDGEASEFTDLDGQDVAGLFAGIDAWIDHV